MQRAIEIADFELPRGPVSIDFLMNQPQSVWGHLRNEINRRRQIDPNRPLARCRLCEGSVFIRSHFARGVYSPVYAHYPEGLDDCPWHQGINLTPDAARAAQYKGQQESAHHRWLCKTIADLLSKDPRCKCVKVETYLRPEIHMRGRYPDVYVELQGLGRFSIEVQLSKPFAPEVMARQLHYEREGVKLLWVFDQLDLQPPQGFQDVITLQRGNAFLFDRVAMEKSAFYGGLRLSCLLEDKQGGMNLPRVISLDDLNLMARPVFLEDRRTSKLLEYCKIGREEWWVAFRNAPSSSEGNFFDDPCFTAAWESIKRFVPSLSDWEHGTSDRRSRPADQHFIKLAAILFSIARSARDDRDRLYISRYTGKGALLAMINSKLTSSSFTQYATVIEKMVATTAVSNISEKDTLTNAIRSAKLNKQQVERGHPVWDGVARLFPEVFDGLLRAELADLDQLPAWATEKHHLNLV